MDFKDVGQTMFEYMRNNRDTWEQQVKFMKDVAEGSNKQLMEAVAQAENIPKSINRRKASFEQSLWTFSGFWRASDSETQQHLLSESFNHLSKFKGPSWCGVEDWTVVNFRSILPELDPDNSVGFKPAMVAKVAMDPQHTEFAIEDTRFIGSLLIRLSLKNKGIHNKHMKECMCSLRQFTRTFVVLGVIELMMCIRDSFLSQDPPDASIPSSDVLSKTERGPVPTTRKEIEQLNALGNKYYKQQSFHEAYRAYTAALRGWCSLGLTHTWPDFEQQLALLHLNCAASLLKLNDYEEMFQHIPFALSHRTTHIKALYKRGQAYEGVGCISKAAADYEHILTLCPSLHEAEVALARVLGQLSGGHRASFKRPIFGCRK